MPLIVANTVLMVATAVFAETYISFLGLGDPSTISWGKLIQNSLEGDAVFHSAWWAIIPPGLCVTIVILACTMMGQSMEDSLNPRLKVGHLSVRRFRMRPLVGRPTRQPVTTPILEAQDLHVWFDLGNDRELHPVQGVNFALGESERMGLVGESGCGKTTTILALMGLLPPNASVAGQGAARRRRHHGQAARIP